MASIGLDSFKILLSEQYVVARSLIVMAESLLYPIDCLAEKIQLNEKCKMNG